MLLLLLLLLCVHVKLNIFHLALAGLKAGDEILEINNRAAGTLNSSMLKDFLTQPSLGLLVRTYPELEGGAGLLESPPHRVDGPVDLGESPLTFLTGNPGMAVHRAGRAPEPRSAEDLGGSSSGSHVGGLGLAGRISCMSQMSVCFLGKCQRGWELFVLGE